MLTAYLEWRGAARDRSASKEERIEAARQEVALGKPRNFDCSLNSYASGQREQKG